MSEKIKVLAFAGSLRKGSYNKALIRTAVEVAPENVAIEVFDLEGIPLFNQEFEANPPQRVKEFKDEIRNADALLIATPEYNYSFLWCPQKRHRLCFETQSRYAFGR